MLTLYYTPGACSMAAHIVLEESGEEYDAKKVDLAGGEQRTEAYLKINPLGRVPALLLDNGVPLAENTAILPFLGKRFDLWPEDAFAEAKALSLIGFFASSVHVAFAHVSRPERYASDSTAFPTLKDTGLKAFHGYVKQIDGMLAEREWFSDRYTVLDPYGFVFYTWGVRRQLPMGAQELHGIQEPDARTASCQTCGGRRTDQRVNRHSRIGTLRLSKNPFRHALILLHKREITSDERNGHIGRWTKRP
jgi:glutathione S-transferase